MIIKAYGEFWSPDLVDWGRRGQGGQASLLGEVGAKRNPIEVDVWEQQAVYVLYNDWEVAYVGQATGTYQAGTLGSRLRAHHQNDRMAGRWDRFSWYGVRAVKEDGKLAAMFKSRPLDAATMLATLEAIAIGAAQPPLNRRNEGYGEAKLVRQAGAGVPRATSSYLTQVLRELEEVKGKLAELDAKR